MKYVWRILSHDEVRFFHYKIKKQAKGIDELSVNNIIKSLFDYAAEIVKFIKYDPSIKVRVPKYDELEEDPAHIFINEEIEIIFNSVKNNHCVYYALLTAYQHRASYI